jgi:hypothetical protein
MRIAGNQFDRSELAGAFGDLGTLIPFVVGYINDQPLGSAGRAAGFRAARRRHGPLLQDAYVGAADEGDAGLWLLVESFQTERGLGPQSGRASGQGMNPTPGRIVPYGQAYVGVIVARGQRARRASPLPFTRRAV